MPHLRLACPVAIAGGVLIPDALLAQKEQAKQTIRLQKELDMKKESRPATKSSGRSK